MTIAKTASRAQRWPSCARWGVGFVLALVGHAGAALALLASWPADVEQIASAPAITVDLAPMPAAPAVAPTEAPPGPLKNQVQSQPEPIEKKPVEKVELPTEPAVQTEVTMPPPKPVEKPPQQQKTKTVPRKRASLESAPSHAERRAEHAAAQAPGVPSHDPSAVPRWKSRLMAQLERHKQYPPEAQSRGEQGVAELAFSVDRNGGVHHARILRSSGSSLLDRATLALLTRAAPLPAPPPEIRGAQIAIQVPIRYSLR